MTNFEANVDVVCESPMVYSPHRASGVSHMAVQERIECQCFNVVPVI